MNKILKLARHIYNWIRNNQKPSTKINQKNVFIICAENVTLTVPLQFNAGSTPQVSIDICHTVLILFYLIHVFISIVD